MTYDVYCVYHIYGEAGTVQCSYITMLHEGIWTENSTSIGTASIANFLHCIVKSNYTCTVVYNQVVA